MQKQELLYSGKAKSLYKTADDSLLVVEFRDDTTAFDGEKHATLSNKGNVNAAISHHLMQILQKEGVTTHFVEKINATEAIVKNLKMLPIECVVRNIAAGSLCRRLGVQSGLTLTPPLFEFFLKNDELHDPMINRDHAVSFRWATPDQLDEMRRLSLTINDILRSTFSDAGLILVDAKYEFGISNGEVVLGDEISPDSCRLWDALTKESLDKDRFRQDLGGVMDSYQEVAMRLGIEQEA